MKDNKGLVNADRDLNMPALPIAKVQEELADATETASNGVGLTKEEAKAMIATWHDVWFTETGTRVLAILPRAWENHPLE